VQRLLLEAWLELPQSGGGSIQENELSMEWVPPAMSQRFSWPNETRICWEQRSGLPDFTWYNIPKRVKIYQITTKLPNGHKIYQMAVEILEMGIKCRNIFHSKSLQKLSILEFLVWKSGNPGSGTKHCSLKLSTAFWIHLYICTYIVKNSSLLFTKFN
jgi:hypothetical protein